MSIEKCTEERFLSDVSKLKMSIIHDLGGPFRHIKFKKPGSLTASFDLICWPNHLTIDGDYGSYTFSRVQDMFMFFRTDKEYKEEHPEMRLFISPGYWGEKLQSICKNGGYKEYSEEIFKDRIKEGFDDYCLDNSYHEQDKKWLWDSIENEVLSKGEFQADAIRAASDFSFDNQLLFPDFWEYDLTKYTFHYIWCLYAIVWGVEKYDESK